MVAQRLPLVVYLVTGVFAAVTCWLFASFTADDAYIVARYAVNARDLGEWAFNPGEHVSAMTSPLHGVVLIGLSVLAADPLSTYKVVALVMVVAASLFLLGTYGAHRHEAMPLAAVIVTPSLTMWTFAGLETPLLAAIVTCMSAVYLCGRALLLLGILAGAAVVARYDAVLFAGPLLLAALTRSAPWRDRLMAAGAAAFLPVVWFLYSWYAFAAILPTSFYVKTPTAERDILVTNIRYMAEHMVITGVALMAVYATLHVGLAERPVRAIRAELRQRWGLHLGLLLVLAYGATMATVHMMFAFRHFMPYIGAAAVALAHLVRRADEQPSPRAAFVRSSTVAAAAAMVILTVHAFQAEALHRRSLQGLGSIGEYDRQGAAAYASDYIPAMERNAADVRAHWATVKQGRPPRIWTFAAGALPYAYREAYIYEQLVSFRHRCPATGGDRPDARVWRAHADYIHAFTRHGSLPRLLAPVRNRQVTLISQHDLYFNGREEKLLVYFNPDPRPHILPSAINEPCVAAASAADGSQHVP